VDLIVCSFRGIPYHWGLICWLLYVHRSERLLSVYVAYGQNASGEFRESTAYLRGACNEW